MKNIVLTPLCLVCVLLATAEVKAIDFNFTARDVNAPVFDASGHLLRRLVADSAVGPYSLPHLDKGQIDFFAVDSAERIAVLTFDQALYHRPEDSIIGDDTVKLVTQQETMTGRGYECRPNAGLLTLRSDVTYESDKVHLTGDRGEMQFDPKGGNRDQMVKDAVVTGNVVVVPAPAAKPEFDRAQTEFAHYDAGAHKIYLKSPVTIWKKGQSSLMNVASGFFEIDLTEKQPSTPGAISAP